jgi:hypothetical protein
MKKRPADVTGREEVGHTTNTGSPMRTRSERGHQASNPSPDAIHHFAGGQPALRILLRFLDALAQGACRRRVCSSAYHHTDKVELGHGHARQDVLQFQTRPQASLMGIGRGTQPTSNSTVGSGSPSSQAA